MKSKTKYLCGIILIIVLVTFLCSRVDSFLRDPKFIDFRSETLKVSLSVGPIIYIEKGKDVVRNDYIIFIVEPLFGTHYFKIPMRQWTLDEYYKEYIEIERRNNSTTN